MVILNDFADAKLKVMYFVHGLQASIGDVIKPRVRELQQANKSVLEAAREIEIAQGRAKSSAAAPAGVASLDAIDWTDTPASTRDAVIAAFAARGDRGGRGGGRGSGRGGRGRGGRGGGQGQGGASDFAIQSRQRARYCQRCRQWGKHKKEECCHSNAEISAMEAMNPNQRPSWAEVHDKFYDELDSAKNESGNE